MRTVKIFDISKKTLAPSALINRAYNQQIFTKSENLAFISDFFAKTAKTMKLKL